MLRTEVLIHIHPEGRRPEGCICTISKTRASVSSGYPNTEKQMKARGRRPSAFIVSRCLDNPDETRSTSFGNNFSCVTTIKEIINKDFQLELFAI